MGHAASCVEAPAPRDGRIQVRHGNMVYTFPAYPTRQGWEARAEHLRRRILVSTGLWPMPEKRPLCPRVTGRVEHEDYTIENVYFESMPGFFVTGNLYRPKGKQGPFPGVACPHGHWEHGRMENSEPGSVPGRCINFARQGYVVYAYDMIGYNDSRLQVSHRDGGDESTGFFDDAKGYLWGISLMGLQLWNSIRVVDYLSSLSDVDPYRIACTGASGGGTQTFMLAAVDKRVRVAAPVNMISAHFQGGCLCENVPNLRLDCYNVEFGAMMAPRSLLLVSATGDWTKNTPKVEFPAVQSIYRLYGATDKVATVQVDAEHNYNQESREAVYAWFGKWLLGLEDAEGLKEQPFVVEPPEEMLVFPDGVLPANAVTGQQLMSNLIRDTEAQIRSLEPVDSATLQAYREVIGTAYQYALDAVQPQACDLQVETVRVDERRGYHLERLLIGRKRVGERMPGLLFVPEQASGAALVVHPDGKAGLVEGDVPGSLVAGLLGRRLMVLAIDTFRTGELAEFQRDESVDHFLTFNRTDTALRVQDILNAIAYLQARTYTVHLVGLGSAGLWCLLARGLASDVAQTVVDADQFDYGNDDAWVEQLFVPQVRRAGDFRTVAALAAPDRLFIHNVSATFPALWFRRVYDVAGAPGALHIQSEKIRGESILDVITG